MRRSSTRGERGSDVAHCSVGAPKRPKASDIMRSSCGGVSDASWRSAPPRCLLAVSRGGGARWGVAIGLLLLVLIPAVIAQSLRRAPGYQSATRAFLEGRYDEVPSLMSDLDQQDPTVAALKARALIARGKYDDAEALLRPVA